ncbi:hypothetical protein [Novosphingobium sp. MBES04]|uniref:hypothetical protein n=1 Tax=Novosphingobium sp. MBES04 TaxID=1206458 RepID=UPI000572F7DA|nr:hypothetical protein [Novosphingobium sp. MBES04]GAM07438.1 superoxide dismutase [Novosphingobium sp. MBES04]
MTIDHLSRRSAIATLGIGAAAMTINEASAQTPAAAPAAVPAFAGNHQVKPLRFNPARLHGLSERLITSHHENNYAGSVKALNMIETRLAAALADTDLPPVVYGGLKREELHRTGSVVLHESISTGSAATARQPVPSATRWARRSARSTAGKPTSAVPG